MSDIHKSAMGRSVDMAALRAKNERVRAVGNMSVNARGDIIDSNNQIINDNNKRVNEYYMKSAMSLGVKPTGINTTPSPVHGIVAEVQQTPLTPDVPTQPIQQYAVEQDYTPIVEANKKLQQEMHPDELDFEDQDEEIVKEEPKSKKSNSSK
jgi:hypothetical protein